MEWPSTKIRQTFLDYFIKNGHTYVKSSPVIPYDDKTLLFANAGMNQFKPIFLGTVNPKSELSKLKRATNSQKCIRAGGKHNDLDDVGTDGTHHTFFEMLGNWSFGDYFKEDTIRFCWELLTEVYGLDKDRLYASYFGGDEKTGLKPDIEAKEIWEKYLPKEKVLPFGAKENFWEMGDTGPCGPCSEIHYDFIGGRDASKLVNMDDPTVIEIWNDVFIQFNRLEDGSLKLLPFKHVDTGMGFERLTSILQNVKTNYDTDLFTPIFKKIQEVTGCRDYTAKYKKDDLDGVDTAYRVVADHLRCVSIAIADGGVPDNYGRGYILRRIIRRAVTYGHKYLGAKKGFFSALPPIIAELFGDFFPEVKADLQNIQAIILDEEVSFSRTLTNGLKYFEKSKYSICLSLQVAGQSKDTGIISGANAFLLYDTYGFPLEDTVLYAKEKGLKVDLKGYEVEKQKGIENSKKVVNKETVVSMKMEAEQVKELQDKNISITSTGPIYEWINVDCKIVGILKDLKFHDEIEFEYVEDKEKEDKEKAFGIIVDQTSFYPEQGGQTYDVGRLVLNDDVYFEVKNVQSYAGYIVHTGYLNVSKELKSYKLKINEILKCDVDFDQRKSVAANHTSTHLLNFSLTKVLGDGTNQKGSDVKSDKFRFDFSYNKQITPTELSQIQNIVQDQIKSNFPVYTSILPLDDAYKVPGVQAMFGEHYPNPVRVISVGAKPEDLKEAGKYSIEFCGGTHLKNTSEARTFVILKEESISKGIRRIMALTGDAAERSMANAKQFKKSVESCKQIEEANEFMAKVQELQIELDNLENFPLLLKHEFREELTSLFKKAKAMQKEIENEILNQVKSHFENVAKNNQEKVIIQDVTSFGGGRNALNKALDTLKKTLPNIPCVLFCVDQNKVYVSCTVPKSLDRVDANELIKELCSKCGGSGGGNKEKAQGQGPDVSKLSELIEFSTKYFSK